MSFFSFQPYLEAIPYIYKIKLETNLDDHLLKKIFNEVTENIKKGDNIWNCKAINLIPSDFQWKEFDYWYEKFEKSNIWPDKWESAKEYFELLRSGSRNIFKKEILELAENSLKRSRAYLFTETIHFRAFDMCKIINLKKQNISKIQILTDEFSCDFCLQNARTTHFINDLPTDLAYFNHPGCRCAIVATI